MTKHEAAVIGAFTGVLCGDFGDLHEYIEKVMDRPVFTHEMGDKEFMDKVKDKTKPDFIAICEEIV